MDRNSLWVGRVAGMLFRVHGSALATLLFFLFASTRKMRLPTMMSAMLGGAPWSPLRWGLVLTLGLLAMLLLVEAARATAARLLGGRVTAVNLQLLGPGPSYEGLSAARQALVVLAGPILCLGGGLLLAVAALGFEELAVDRRFALQLLGEVAIALGIIDLLPAAPLAGGQLLALGLEARLGRRRAREVATTTGRILAIGLAVAGALTPSLALLTLAALLWAAASRASDGQSEMEALRGVTVGQACSPLGWIDGGATLAGVAERMRGHHGLALAVAEGPWLVGVVRAADVARVDPSERERRTARQLVRTARVVASSLKAGSALALLRTARSGVVLVAERGQLIGLVSRASLEEAAQLAALGPLLRAPQVGYSCLDEETTPRAPAVWRGDAVLRRVRRRRLWHGAPAA